MSENKLKITLTWKEGTALSISAVIGCGILVLPAITAQKAGPASLLVWIIISLLAFPICSVLGKLSKKIPKAGGIASFMENAFGPKAGAITSWILLGSIPIGVPAIALSGAYYLTYIFPLSLTQLVLVAAFMIYFSIYLNIKGIDISSKVSSIVILLIISIILIIIIFSLSNVKLNNFQPMAPHGIKPILAIFPSIFFAFAGFELVIPLAEEFKNPSRDIPISLFLSAFFIALLYNLLSFVTIGTGIYIGENASTPLSSLIALSFGKISGYIVALLTVLITFCSIHASIAGFSRIIYNGARNGEFPKVLAKLHSKYQTPIYTVMVLGIVCTIVLLCFSFISSDLNDIVKFPGSIFLFSYLIAMACGLKLLKCFSLDWIFALTSFIMCLIILLCSGLVALFPITLAIIGFIYISLKERKINKKLDDNFIG